MTKHRQPESEAIGQLFKESSICATWMTRRVYTVAPSDSLEHARELLKLHHVNQLPVVGHGRKVLGIVTDRDLRNALGKTPRLPDARECLSHLADVTVGSVMSHPAISLSSHNTLVNAAAVMRATRIGSVPIVDGDSLVGIITRSDILDAFVAFANGHYRRDKAAKAAGAPKEDLEVGGGMCPQGGPNQFEPRAHYRGQSK